MKKIAPIFIIVFTVLFYGCDEDQFKSNLNYVSFENTVYSTGVDVGSSTDFNIKVYSSNITNSDRTFDITVDPSSNAAAGSYVVPNSVTIPAGTNEGEFTVTLSDIDLGIGVNKLKINFTGDILAKHETGSSTTIEYIQNCTEVSATLDITFDGYGSETTWEITDALGGVVADGGPFSDGQATSSETFALCSGREYTFTIYDAYGDGLSYPNSGSYTLTVDGSTKASGGGDFGDSESTEFNTSEM